MDGELLLQELLEEPKGDAMPLDGFVTAIATNMILEVGVDERFNAAPSGLAILPSGFPPGRVRFGLFLCSVCKPLLCLFLKLRALCPGAVFGGRRAFLLASSSWPLCGECRSGGRSGWSHNHKNSISFPEHHGSRAEGFSDARTPCGHARSRNAVILGNQCTCARTGCS